MNEATLAPQTPKMENKVVGNIELQAQHILAYLLEELKKAQQALISSEIHREFLQAQARVTNFATATLTKAKLDSKLHGFSQDLKYFVELVQTEVKTTEAGVVEKADASLTKTNNIERTSSETSEGQ